MRETIKDRIILGLEGIKLMHQVGEYNVYETKTKIRDFLDDIEIDYPNYYEFASEYMYATFHKVI